MLRAPASRSRRRRSATTSTASRSDDGTSCERRSRPPRPARQRTWRPPRSRCVRRSRHDATTVATRARSGRGRVRSKSSSTANVTYFDPLSRIRSPSKVPASTAITSDQTAAPSSRRAGGSDALARRFEAVIASTMCMATDELGDEGTELLVRELREPRQVVRWDAERVNELFVAHELGAQVVLVRLGQPGHRRELADATTSRRHDLRSRGTGPSCSCTGAAPAHRCSRRELAHEEQVVVTTVHDDAPGGGARRRTGSSCAARASTAVPRDRSSRRSARVDGRSRRPLMRIEKDPCEEMERGRGA